MILGSQDRMQKLRLTRFESHPYRDFSRHFSIPNFPCMLGVKSFTLPKVGAQLMGEHFLVVETLLSSPAVLHFALLARKHYSMLVVLKSVALACLSPALVDATTSLQYEGMLVSVGFLLLSTFINFAFDVNDHHSVGILALITGAMTFIDPRIGLVAIDMAPSVSLRQKRIKLSILIIIVNVVAGRL